MLSRSRIKKQEAESGESSKKAQTPYNGYKTEKATKLNSIPLGDLTVSCANEHIKPANIKILWSENNYSLPITVIDGFNAETFVGKVTSNAFSWDRGANQASLDRNTGVLTIRPKKDGVLISLRCKKLE